MTRRRVVTEDKQREWLRRNVRVRRDALGLTLKVASKPAKMHWRHWQKLEHSETNVTLRTLARVATVLGMDVVEMLRNPARRRSGGEPTAGIGMELGSVTTQEALRKRLAVKVRALRTKLKLTLKVASESVQMHWRHWQKIEAGEVNATLHTLVRLAMSLRTVPAELFSDP